MVGAQPADVSILTSGHDVADARLHRHVAAFLARGLRVEVLGLGDPAHGPRGAQVHTWPRRGGFPRAALAVRLACQATGRVLLTLDPDSAIAAAAVRSRKKRRLVVDVHEDYGALLADRPWARGARRWAADRLVRVFLSVAARADLTVVADDHVPPLTARHRLVVRNTPDLSLLPVPGPPGPTPRALYVGDLRASRGLFAMIAAVRDAADWQLDLVGPVAPADRAKLDELLSSAPDLADRVHQHGRLPPAASWTFAREAWAGLLLLADTPAFREAQPSKLGEYLACGLPVITTDLPRPAALIERTGAGVVVPSGPDDVVGREVSSVLRGWSADPVRLEQARRRARERAAAVRQDPGPSDHLADLVVALS